jgi:putative nucleotidyltransferase with HDIG domain
MGIFRLLGRSSTQSPKRASLFRKIFYVALFLVSMLVLLLAVLLPSLSSPALPAPEVGQVSQRSYTSPVTIEYVSQVVTDQRGESAARAVAPIYTPPEPQIARRQLESLGSALAFISSVRADAYATQQQKLEDLAALEDVSLSQESALTILELSDSRWLLLQQESMEVLEQIMGGEIRPDGVSNAQQRARLLVSLAFSERQAAVVAELAAAFVIPNSQYSESLTEAARQKARETVTPYKRTLVEGETIVSPGAVFNREHIEALQQVGLAQPEQNLPNLISAAALVVLLITFLALYFSRQGVRHTTNPRSLALIMVLFVIFALVVRLAAPGRSIVPYAFPLASYSLIVAALFGARVAMISSLPLAILATYGLPNALDLTVYYIMGCIFGVLALRSAQRLSSFFTASMAITAAGGMVIIVYRLANTDTLGVVSLVGASLFNGLASASIALLLQFVLAQFLGLTTAMQLMELTRPDQPLLKQLLRDAPGTYQHSLQVANLAEQAAERIGADTLLTRVGALFHDIGKSLNPIFFIENQPPGFANPHESLTPEESSAIIVRHVTEGLDLARKHRLPTAVRDFISEHHGDLVTTYQYITAVKAAGGDESQVDIEQYRYPGPRPQSRETAILMLADGCEARVRAERPANEAELFKMIKEVISDRAAQGQLDHTHLTMRDLMTVAESFVATLRGIYHLRVKYPQLDKPVEQPGALVYPASSKADTQPVHYDKPAA